MKDIDRLFYSKPRKLLIMIASNGKCNKCFGSYLAKEINVTYSHAVNIIVMLEEMKLITTEKIGRKKELNLTKKGREIANHLIELERILT